MAAIRDDLPISGADQLDEKSCLKRRIFRVAFLIRMVLRLFPFPFALLSVAVICIKETAKFVVSKLADSGAMKTPCGWFSLPYIMFVALNIVIVILAINSGVLSSLTGNKGTWTPSVDVCFHRIAEIEPCCLNDYAQGECQLDLEPTTDIQGLTHVLCKKIENFDCTAPSWHSMKYLLSDAEQENFVKNSDTAILGSFSVDCRVLNSPISKLTVNEMFEDRLTSSPKSFFVEVSHGKAEMDVKFKNDRPKQNEEWNADELFLKSEDFIENFKRRLMIERQNSWKRLHEIYTESCGR